MAQFVKVAQESELPIGSRKEVELAGRVVALFNVAGRIYAIDGICPHQGGPLSEGELDGCVVTCPWHGWQFDVSNGRNVYSSTLNQDTYEVKVERGEVLVSVP